MGIGAPKSPEGLLGLGLGPDPQAIGATYIGKAAARPDSGKVRVHEPGHAPTLEVAWLRRRALRRLTRAPLHETLSA